jgi:hypothetical protein
MLLVPNLMLSPIIQLFSCLHATCLHASCLHAFHHAQVHDDDDLDMSKVGKPISSFKPTSKVPSSNSGGLAANGDSNTNGNTDAASATAAAAGTGKEAGAAEGEKVVVKKKKKTKKMSEIE